MMQLYRIGILLRAHQGTIGLSGGLMTGGEWLIGSEAASIGTLAVFNLILAMAGVLDGHYRRIFNPLTLLLAMVGLIRLAVVGDLGLWDSLLGMGILGGSLLLISWLTKGGMGAGDIKLGAAAGLWLGSGPALVALYIAFITGALYGGYLWIRQGRFTSEFGRKTIPFGPFLAGGCSLALSSGDGILQTYLSLF